MNRAWWPLAAPILALTLIVAPPQAKAETEASTSLTLEQIFRTVLSDNETIGRAWAEVAKAEAVHKGAWSQVIPSLTFSGSLTRYDEAQSLDFGVD
jgi:outer membrane protein TolC